MCSTRYALRLCCGAILATADPVLDGLPVVAVTATWNDLLQQPAIALPDGGWRRLKHLDDFIDMDTMASLQKQVLRLWTTRITANTTTSWVVAPQVRLP